MPSIEPINIQSPHVQVEEALTKLVKEMRPGDQLPPEPKLARQLGVSRATLREVLRLFVDRGILARRHGVGTFVASRIPVLETGIEVLESIDRMSERLGLETEMAHLELVERLATPFEVAGLGMPEGSAVEVLVINRVIAIAGEPVADLRDIVPQTYLQKDDLNEDFRGSVLDVFLKRGTPMLSTSRTEIMAASATSKFAQRLHVPRQTALIKLVGQLYSFDEKVIDYSVSYFVPGHFKFHVIRRVT